MRSGYQVNTMKINRVAFLRNWSMTMACLLLIMTCVPVVFAQRSADSANEIQRLSRTAQVAAQQGRHEDALRLYNQIAALAASEPKIAARAHFNIGNTYMQLKKFDLAVSAFQRAVALDPALADAHNNMGESLGELRQYPRALESFTRASALDPQLSKARYNMGVTYDRLGQLKYAEFIYRHLIRDKPEYSLAYDGLAVTLSKSGRAAEAIPFHEKAISLNPRDGSFYYNLAISYLIMGNQIKAREQEERLRQIDPQVAGRLASVINKAAGSRR
jgi:tetratricopeptide (TPR) repeat protein